MMKIMHGIYLFLVHLLCSGLVTTSNPPNIIFIYADDLGWNDVSFHGSPEIPTPNIDALALNGIVLNNYYGEWLCTPSRAALLTGKYPMRLGLQHYIIKAMEAAALPIDEVILPQHLKKLDYDTHMIGKWHMGYYKSEFMPTNRGFDTFFGYMNGGIDYYDYTYFSTPEEGDKNTYLGIDLYNGTQPITNFRAEYATRVFATKAKNIILNHDTSKPLFLYLAQLAVHPGNPFQPLQAPPEVIANFMYIKNETRRIQAAVTSVMDESVGTVFKALHEKDMLQNSIVLFVSDNGGQVDPAFNGYSSNYPLRGNKETYWEGAIHVPAVIWSPLLKLDKPRISKQFMHVTDWLPTLYNAAGGDVSDLGKIDGHDMWETLVEDASSPRKDLLHNLDPILEVSSYRKGDLKIVNGTTGTAYNFWHGPTGFENLDEPNCMEKWIFKDGSPVRDILEENGMWIAENSNEMYKNARISCGEPPSNSAFKCDPDKKPCLFNITQDPCEYNDLADIYPEVVSEMMNAIYEFQKQAMKPQSKPRDPRGDPMCYNFTYVPWLDPEYYAECNYAA